MLVPAGAGDDMLAGSVSLAMHIALQYKPDVIGVSFGADGHQDEGLGLKYTERVFYDLGITLRQLGVKTFAVLEGGYHRLVCECIDFFIAGIAGRRYAYDAPNSISSQALWDKYNCAMKDVRAVVMGTGGMHQASELDIDVVL
jgi:acetoin utilization deacetylase AcuC-like enzyme